jgi:hypothetical protein
MLSGGGLPGTFMFAQVGQRSCGHSFDHSVGRVLSFFFSRGNWNSPTLLAAGQCAPQPFGTGGEDTLLAGEGLGESNFDEGKYTVVLYIYIVITLWF